LPAKAAAAPRDAKGNRLDATKRKYRANLPRPEDTTQGDASTLLTPGFLRFVGELLFGERWQSPLAQGLGATRGKTLSPATVHRWSMGLRTIPGWVGEALLVLIENGRRELDRRASVAGALATRIRNPRAGATLGGELDSLH